ncbi:hypothetical protein [Streptomyces sp. NPDC059649]|uniref:hypothetical protein n=1 Tax=Streptomyces sp. NPDC059649 TaxID=3346895 RepID=UPI0036A168E2
MTPHSLAFYLDVVTSGTVLGAQPTDQPDRVTGILGKDFAENRSGRHHLWRDYGLAEFFWQRESGNGPWAGHHFTLQVHRLAHGGKVVNGEILSRYGRFARRLRFGKLQRLLANRGTALREIPPGPGQDPCYRLFWNPVSWTCVTVIAAKERYRTPDDLQVGDVYSITAPMTPEEVAWRAAR